MAKKITPSHPLQPGDVLVYSWGYGQTNVQFFEVRSLRGRTQVELIEIEAEVSEAPGYSDMSGFARPRKGAVKRDATPLRRRVDVPNWDPDRRPVCKMDYGWARLTDPAAPHYTSWYA
jgi:hypothetical protein